MQFVGFSLRTSRSLGDLCVPKPLTQKSLTNCG
jgi:hypothetical protein